MRDYIWKIVHPYPFSFESATFFLCFFFKSRLHVAFSERFRPSTRKSQKHKYCWGCMRIYHATWCHLSKTDSFVRKDDEVEGLLRVIIEYKVVKTSENVDWESCQTKHSDILELLVVQYLSPDTCGRKAYPFSNENRYAWTGPEYLFCSHLLHRFCMVFIEFFD